MTDPQRDPLRPNGHSKVSYPPEWFDPGMTPEEWWASEHEKMARRNDVLRSIVSPQPGVSRGVQRWVLIALFALGLGIGLVLGWRWA